MLTSYVCISTKVSVDDTLLAATTDLICRNCGGEVAQTATTQSDRVSQSRNNHAVQERDLS